MIKKSVPKEAQETFKPRFLLRRRGFTKSACYLFLLFLAGAGEIAAAAPLLHQLLDLQAQPDAAREVEEYWTPERRAAALPMPLIEPLPEDTVPLAPPLSRLDTPPPAVMPGWPPGQETAGPRSVVESTLGEIETGEMRRHVEFLQAPGGTGPQFPEDFANYTPFQRWTWSESYLNYPTSTIGVLFLRWIEMEMACWK